MKKITNRKTVPKRGFCRSFKTSEKDKLYSLDKIVSDYIRNYRAETVRELSFFRNLPSLERAVECAGFAVGPDGKKFSHQWRIPRQVLKKSRAILCQLLKQIQECRDFEELMEIIEKAIGDIPGIGELTIYDTTLRIAAKLGFEPQYVHIHAGTKEGAKVLGINVNRKSFNPSELSDEFRKLKPHEIEDCLCIYKEELANLPL